VHDPERPKKLLLNKKELKKLFSNVMEKGLTIVPSCIYFKGQRAKVEISLARGKKSFDKRRDIAKKDEQRRLERDYKVSSRV
jgi:SsrA-binding protein